MRLECLAIKAEDLWRLGRSPFAIDSRTRNWQIRGG
jgi:hypothetical protein